MLGHGVSCDPVGTTRRILRQDADQNCNEHGVQFPGYCSWELDKLVVSSVVVADRRHGYLEGSWSTLKGGRSS